MKTENRLNHLLHVVLCLVTVGFWVPVYVIRLCANEMGNRLVRQYNAGWKAAPQLMSGAQRDALLNAAANGIDAAGNYIRPEPLTVELRELQSKLSRCEFDKSLYHLRLCQLVSAVNVLPLTCTNSQLREVHPLAQKLAANTSDTEYTRVIRHADALHADLRRLVTALASMTDPEDQIIAHPGPELDELQKAYKQAVAGVYWGRPQ
jgi:hypothetical protein